jgi:hypothetical protein
MPDGEQVPISEVVQLAAIDSLLFARTFFPKTVRQEPAVFHSEVWDLLESEHRLVNLQIFRDGAKTTTCRLYGAKRIAYAIARTILFVGKSEGHAVRSTKWLRKQVQHNRRFADTFGLRPGKKWQDTEAEIIHGEDEQPIWIMATGITGSTRGILQDDFRPDLIIVDDVIDEENSATPDGRQKISDLIYGALVGSLAPASESPDAKLVMLQTPLNKEDASTLALKDKGWKSKRFGCWTPATEGLDLRLQESVWPERWPSAEMRQKKEEYISRNKLSLFLREYECKITSPETAAFGRNWLEYYQLAPEHLVKSMAIDPVPPPSDIQIAKGLRGKDYEAFAVVGAHAGDVYLLDYSLNRGHEPDWTIMEFFRLCLKWRPRIVTVETTAYQRTLKWLLEQAMRNRRQYWVVQDFTDSRSKFDRIVDSLSGVASQGRFYVKEEHTEFISQFESYPDIPNEDLLEATAVATAKLLGLPMGDDAEDSAYAELMAEEKDIPALEYHMGAP